MKTTQYEGVFWDANCQLWRASIDIRGKPKFLGVFATDTEAAQKRMDTWQKEEEKEKSSSVKKAESAQRYAALVPKYSSFCTHTGMLCFFKGAYNTE